jgi:hypothetical protein
MSVKFGGNRDGFRQCIQPMDDSSTNFRGLTQIALRLELGGNRWFIDLIFE